MMAKEEKHFRYWSCLYEFIFTTTVLLRRWFYM